MREVAVSRFVPATPAELDTLVGPRELIEFEGSFSVDQVVDQGDNSTLVAASGPGLTLQYRFEQREEGWYYEQAGDAGPFETMETDVTVDRENEGSRVQMHSTVALSLPVPFADRIAGWKRRGELERALDSLRERVKH